MSRKTLLVLAALACGALVAAGVAVASRSSGAIQTASATFDATTVTKSQQKTCTVNGGDTYALTRATYTGTASSSDARLNGPITIRAASLVDTTTGVGALVGKFRIDGASSAGAHGDLEAAIDNGQASGLVRGVANGPQGRLIASLGSGFTGGGGFSSGLVGGPTLGAGSIFSGECVHAVRGHGHGKAQKLKLTLNF